MMLEYLVHIISELNSLPMMFRLIIVVLAAAIEYVLPIFPGDTVVVMMGFLSAQGGLGLVEISLAALMGSVLGAWITYIIGRAAAQGQRAKRFVERLASLESLKRWKHWFHRWGYFLILVNRFFPGIRSFFFIAAGLYKLPLVPVLLYGALSALIFNACLFGLGYFLGNNVEVVLGLLDSYTKIVYIILALIVAIFIIIHGRRWHKKRQRSRAQSTKDHRLQK